MGLAQAGRAHNKEGCVEREGGREGGRGGSESASGEHYLEGGVVEGELAEAVAESLVLVRVHGKEAAVDHGHCHGVPVERHRSRALGLGWGA